MFELIVGFILLFMVGWFIHSVCEAKRTPRLRKHVRARNKNDYWNKI